MDKKKKLWNAAKPVLKAGFIILLLVFVVRRIDVDEVKAIFLRCNPWYIAAAFLSYFLSQVVSSWRLLSFLRSIDLDLPFGFNMRLYLLGMFYNIFLPGGVGGDGYKIYLLRKRFKKPTKKIFFALLFDRVSGLWAIGALSVALVILIPRIDALKIWAVLALIVGTLVYYAVLRKFFTEFARYFIVGHARAIAVQSFQLLSVIFILTSLDFQGKFSPYLFSFLISSLTTIIAGLGPRELLMTEASDFFGMNASLAVFVTVTFYLLSTFAALPGLWFVYRSREFEPMPDEEEVKAVEDDVDDVIESHQNTP